MLVDLSMLPCGTYKIYTDLYTKLPIPIHCVARPTIETPMSISDMSVNAISVLTTYSFWISVRWAFTIINGCVVSVCRNVANTMTIAIRGAGLMELRSISIQPSSNMTA